MCCFSVFDILQIEMKIQKQLKTTLGSFERVFVHFANAKNLNERLRVQ
jgi:guanylate kinase